MKIDPARLREVYPLDRMPCAWCGADSWDARQTPPIPLHHYDCPVPDIHQLLGVNAELLAACTLALEYFDSDPVEDCEPGCGCFLHPLRAAIAKAEGR